MNAEADIEHARYARVRWNTPLSCDHAATLLERLELASAGSIVDLGCGWGELLLRAVDAAGEKGNRRLTAMGVDTDGVVLARARDLAGARGVAARVRFLQTAADEWTEPADRVLCIGAAHAFGGTSAALFALRKLVLPGGRLLFGDGCWERPPTPNASTLFGETLHLHEIVKHASEVGWRTLHLSTADLREWDDFESSWRSGPEEWLLAHPKDPKISTVREQLDRRMAEYVNVYRGVLSFCYLVLVR